MRICEMRTVLSSRTDPKMFMMLSMSRSFWMNERSIFVTFTSK